MNERTPLIRLSKRENMPRSTVWLIRVSSVILAILLGCIIFLIVDANPLTAYRTIISGALGKASGIRQVVKNTIPLLGTALALAPCFRMKYWNIGAEGQITMGALGAAFFAINCWKSMPSALLLIVMAAASVLCGAVWSVIPAFFKSRWGTNETLFTLMMNYIAIGIVGWLQGGPWEGKKGSQIIPLFNEKALLPKVFGVQIGWIVVLLLTAFMFIYMTKTKHGYEIAVLGESENTAVYAGMNVGKVTVRTAALSGAICGLVGFLIASGTNQTLYSDIAGGAGFTAITVCWLAQLNPFAMVVIAAMLAVLAKGASSIQTALSIPASISDILTGIILLCMLGCEFFINYKMTFRGHHEEAGAKAAAETAQDPSPFAAERAASGSGVSADASAQVLAPVADGLATGAPAAGASKAAAQVPQAAECAASDPNSDTAAGAGADCTGASVAGAAVCAEAQDLASLADAVSDAGAEAQDPVSLADAVPDAGAEAQDPVSLADAVSEKEVK